MNYEALLAFGTHSDLSFFYLISNMITDSDEPGVIVKCRKLKSDLDFHSARKLPEIVL